ncbi:MAG TPA: hypothetical protein VHK69_03285 [Chitinophagaceae bacterium]|jgi:hypothetical protein|nr:hypothetical protein [Chitinophagaceae bacterium]
MLLFTTVLFIGEEPVGYSVFQEEDKYVFQPSENSLHEVEAPSFTVCRQGEEWVICGIEDVPLLDQIRSELDVYAGSSLFTQTLSAAP